MSRRLLLLVCLAVTHAVSQQQNATKENQTQNKTKRGLTEQTRTFHDVESFKPLVLYPELAAAGASHSEAYANTPKSPAFDSEPPKQVTAQQVLYEYQQTPSTTISNVHVNQQFQTVPTPETANSQVVYASQLPPATPTTQFVNQGQNLEAQQNQHSLSVQNVVHPVQHSALIKHGQNYGQIAYQPSAPAPRTPAVYQTRNPPPQPLNQYVSTTVQPTQSTFYSTTQHFPAQQNPFSQGKYLYVNGKILYYPQGVPTTPTPYPGTLTKHPAISYQNHQHKPVVPLPKPHQKPVAPTPSVSPVQYYNNYVPKKLAPTTTKAPVAPVKQEPRREEEEEEEDEPEQRPKARPVEEDDEEEDEEEERPVRYYHDDDDDDDDEEEEDERPKKYVPKYYRSKYLYSPTKDELEEEDDDEEDSEREQSKQVKQKTKKPKKYYKGDIYLKPTKDKNKFENSKYFVFFDPLKEDPKKTAYLPRDSEPKYSKLYASYKSPQKKSKSKTSGDVFEEPQMEYTVYKYHKVEPQKEDQIEGRFSENVPVIHTQKVVKKQWLVTKTEQ